MRLQPADNSRRRWPTTNQVSMSCWELYVPTSWAEPGHRGVFGHRPPGRGEQALEQPPAVQRDVLSLVPTGPPPLEQVGGRGGIARAQLGVRGVRCRGALGRRRGDPLAVELHGRHGVRADEIRGEIGAVSARVRGPVRGPTSLFRHDPVLPDHHRLADRLSAGNHGCSAVSNVVSGAIRLSSVTRPDATTIPSPRRLLRHGVEQPLFRCRLDTPPPASIGGRLRPPALTWALPAPKPLPHGCRKLVDRVRGDVDSTKS